jgi:hypothetical protein
MGNTERRNGLLPSLCGRGVGVRSKPKRGRCGRRERTPKADIAEPSAGGGAEDTAVPIYRDEEAEARGKREAVPHRRIKIGMDLPLKIRIIDIFALPNPPEINYI